MANATRALGAALPLQAGEHAASVTLAASGAAATRARRWLDDLTAGAIEHELDTEQAIAAVNALYPGGWPAFVGPAGPVQCNRWFDDEPLDPAVCSDCGIETLDWWVDADDLIHCDDADACRPAAPTAFEAHVAEVAPWFQADDATMARIAGTWTAMAECACLLREVRPQVERLIELGSATMQAVDEISAGIPDAVWNATPEIVDEWVVINSMVGGDVAIEAMELGERLAHIDPPVTPRSGQDSTSSGAKKSAPTAKPLPPEAIAYLVEHGVPVAYPAGAVSGPRWNEPCPSTAIHAVHWLRQGRADIAEHGVDWATGHATGLELAAVAEGAWVGQLSSLAAEVHGRPDPLAGSSAAWVRDENAAEQATAMRVAS
jgi:hypothetical protein